MAMATANRDTTLISEFAPHPSLTAASPGRQLFVGNLPFSVQWQELKDLFKECGTVVRADVATTPAGRSRGFGTVLFAKSSDAANAIARFSQYEWYGRGIDVREDRALSTGNTGVEGPIGGPAIDTTPGLRSVYVGNLPYSVGWQDLKARIFTLHSAQPASDLFKSVGNVIRADIQQDYRKKSKGFGTVLMQTPEEARNAIAKLNGYEWNGRQIEVREERTHQNDHGAAASGGSTSAPHPYSPAIDPASNGGSASSRQLYVGNLVFTIQWQELKDLFRQAGNVVRADVAQDAQGRSRGYGTIVMATPQEAQAAVTQFNGTDLQGRTIEVREDKFAAETTALPGTQVFVGNLPYTTRWQDLKDAIRNTGLNPVHADIMIEQGTGRSKGCGTVRFTSREEAEKAVEVVNGLNIAGRNIVVRLDKFA
ncbi:hypothetical protein SmJEL517_g03931 [Synchytrium microbalum]|uniref:RRM domain-containing protein n=1 Tax=Synchytrium microbalum TaxID=1806994 RepID=A0A507C558_9FUNG|nr:uncharacterized protein SmJEL517_g03931 [Synchytrium microbalum]TPX33116.1 hypothetical protein SmJEL517_g03931 [Synchytrium microbalum]